MLVPSQVIARNQVTEGGREPLVVVFVNIGVDNTSGFLLGPYMVPPPVARG